MNRVRVKAEKIEAYNLKPGDLFSTVGPEYWELAMDRGNVGEQLFVRTNESGDDVDDKESYVYRIYIELTDAEGQLAQATKMDPHSPPGVKK